MAVSCPHPPATRRAHHAQPARISRPSWGTRRHEIGAKRAALSTSCPTAHTLASGIGGSPRVRSRRCHPACRIPFHSKYRDLPWKGVVPEFCGISPILTFHRRLLENQWSSSNLSIGGPTRFLPAHFFRLRCRHRSRARSARVALEARPNAIARLRL